MGWFALSDDQMSLVREFRVYLDSFDWERWAARGEAESIHRDNDGGHEFLRKLGRDRWLGIDWPQSVGGRGRSAIDAWLVREELAFRHLPTGGLGLSSIGPALVEAASDEQQRRYLPGMLSGEIDIVVGYTEPGAGSDLASLRTKASRHGDTFVINGHKTYITGAHCATHIWVAARTGATDSGSHGLSVLIVPMNEKGIEVLPQPTQGGGQTNDVYFTDVKVPAEDMIGLEGGGWPVIRLALSRERTFHFSGLAAEFRRLITFVSRRSDLAGDPGVKRMLAHFATDLELARLLSFNAASQVGDGRVSSSMTKIWVSELRQRIASVGLELLGEEGQLARGSGAAPLEGNIEQLFRFFPMMKVGGGTNEIQRNIIGREFVKNEVGLGAS